MGDTEKFNWRKKDHRRAFMWRLVYNLYRLVKKKKWLGKLSLWDDYLSDEYYDRVDKALNNSGGMKK